MKNNLLDISADEITQYDRKTVIEWVIARTENRSQVPQTEEQMDQSLRESIQVLHRIRQLQADAPPQGPDGEPVMSCATCAEAVYWIDCPTGGWWAHAVHPNDDHDAATSTFGDKPPPWAMEYEEFGYPWT